MHKTIAIIPARGGSKRLPSKNIINLGGKPLIAHSIEFALLNNNIIDEVYVSTDDEAIKEIALECGAQVIDRPASLSGDFEPTSTTLSHALTVIQDPVDTVVLLQATNPLRPKNLLKEAFDKYKMSRKQSLFTVSRDHKKLGKIINDTFEPYNYEIGQRSQDLEPLFYENGLMYITKASLIREGTIFNNESLPFVVNHKFATVDIDTKEDLDYASYILKYFNEK